MNIINFSYRIFGGVANWLKQYFPDLKEDLEKAQMKYILEEWLSICLFTGLLTFISLFILLSIVLNFIGLDLLFAELFAFTISLVLSGGSVFIAYIYPYLTYSNKEGEMKKILPFGVSYMASMSSKNTQPISYFRMISKFNEYKELRKECESIVRDVDIIGMDLISSMKKHAENTTSEELKEFLWGFISTLESGGSTKNYLDTKSKEFMKGQKRILRGYARKLSLFVEIYMTLIIVGSIFFIIISSIISSISSGFDVVLLQTFIVFILLPLVSIGFIVLVKSISPVN